MSPSMEKTPSVMIMREPLVHVLLQLLLQVPHVRVLEGVLHRLAQAHAVHNGGMHQPVGDHHILVAEERLEDAPVGIHARGGQQGGLGARGSREPLLQLAMDVLRAADEAHRGHPVAAMSNPAWAAVTTSGWLESPR